MNVVQATSLNVSDLVHAKDLLFWIVGFEGIDLFFKVCFLLMDKCMELTASKLNLSY